jgi:hypothetical protein
MFKKIEYPRFFMVLVYHYPLSLNIRRAYYKIFREVLLIFE